MNITLWILQILLALHTAIGAVWKFSHSAEQTMPSLAAIPQPLWMVLAIVELIFAVMLVAPAIKKSLGKLVPVAAVGISVVMMAYCVLHILSKDPNYSPMIYWIVVAFISDFIAVARLTLKKI